MAVVLSTSLQVLPGELPAWPYVQVCSKMRRKATVAFIQIRDLDSQIWECYSRFGVPS